VTPGVCYTCRSRLKAELRDREHAFPCARGMLVEQRDFEHVDAVGLSKLASSTRSRKGLTPEVVCILSVGAELWVEGNMGSACGGARGLQ
jgi:hypothetical protein